MKTPVLAALFVVALPAWCAGFTPLDRPTARTLVDPQSHRQPTIVALWSSDCTHCKKNFGLFAAMAQANKRLKVITVATEPASPVHAPLLEKYALPGTRYAYGGDAPEALAYALDPTWSGELPRTFLFDGKGNMVKVSGVLKPDDAQRAVTPR